MDKKLIVECLTLGGFVGGFVVFVLSLSFGAVAVMLVSIAAFFCNEFVAIKNKYEARLTEIENKINQHLLENNLNRL